MYDMYLWLPLIYLTFPYVAVNSGSTYGADVVHPNVQCDGCEKPVRGDRFKCTTCPDYDLCHQCHCRGVHGDHDMLCIRTPGRLSVSRYWVQRFPMLCSCQLPICSLYRRRLVKVVKYKWICLLLLKGYSSQGEIHSIYLRLYNILVVYSNCADRSLINN